MTKIYSFSVVKTAYFKNTTKHDLKKIKYYILFNLKKFDLSRLMWKKYRKRENNLKLK